MTGITYDLDWDAVPPKPGEYLVSLGKRGIGSVWHVAQVAKVRHKTARRYQSYRLSVEACPELKPLTIHDPATDEVWVRGEAAHTLVWYPRSKKS